MGGTFFLFAFVCLDLYSRDTDKRVLIKLLDQTIALLAYCITYKARHPTF